MAIFTSDEGEGGTTAERVALIGIICLSFSWIPIFIIWKLISAYRRRTRSQEQEVEFGNMPVQTNPSKPNRESWKPPPPVQQSIGLTNNPQELRPTVQRQDGFQKEHSGKRAPMSTQPTDHKIKMFPSSNGPATEVQQNRSQDAQHERSGSRLLKEPTQPHRASFRHFNQPVDHDSDESSATPGPSFRVPPKVQRSARKSRFPDARTNPNQSRGRRKDKEKS